MRSKRLSRQIKKCFGSETFDKDLDGQNPELAQKMSAFFEMVDELYAQQDEKTEVAQRNLALSSVELTESNGKLYQLNQTFDALVNSLDQGFFLFDQNGVCLPVASKVCADLIEVHPAGKRVSEVLKISQTELGLFDEWRSFIFAEKLAFSDMAALGPSQFLHSGKKEVTLEYKPCRDSHGKLLYVVVIATDRTSEFMARRQAEDLEGYVKMVVGILKNKDYFKRFVAEIRRMLDELQGLVNRTAFSDEDLVVAKRLLHTVKGAATTFGLSSLKDGCQQDETAINECFQLEVIQSYLQKAVVALQAKFETLLKSNRDIIGDLNSANQTREVSTNLLWKFAKRIVENSVPDELKKIYVNEILSVPLEKIFGEFNQTIKDIGGGLKKNIDPIRFEGGEICVLEENYRDVFTSLVHVFRNIADHGIELPEVREAVGKPSSGKVSVKFSVSGSPSHRLHIAISDDGAGIDPERIRGKLKEAGRANFAESATTQQLLNQIFESGFSTAEQVSEISGRGVGMEAVRAEILKLGGRIDVASTLGSGTTFIIDLPLLNEMEVIQSLAI